MATRADLIDVGEEEGTRVRFAAWLIGSLHEDGLVELDSELRQGGCHCRKKSFGMIQHFCNRAMAWFQRTAQKMRLLASCDETIRNDTGTLLMDMARHCHTWSAKVVSMGVVFVQPVETHLSQQFSSKPLAFEITDIANCPNGVIRTNLPTLHRVINI